MKRYIGLGDMSKVNCSSVLNVIREAGKISRKQISEETGLSWAGMTKIVNKLFEKGYIVENKSENAVSAGRIPNYISIRKNYNVVIGLDINREGFSGCVMNLAGDVLKEYIMEVSFDRREELLDYILTFTSRIIRENRERKILAIGVAMQGIVDVERGISVKFPHCRYWNNIPLKKIMEDHFNYKVYIEHDPNCVLYADIYKEPSKNSLLFRVDRSIGMAVSVEGKILGGKGIMEVAHNIVVPNGKLCTCGQRGCLEAYLAPCLVNKELQMEAVEEMIQPLAITMSNMSQIFNADIIILTGDLMVNSKEFKRPLLDEFNKYNNNSEIVVNFVETAKQSVHGAALIAASAAIDEIDV